MLLFSFFEVYEGLILIFLISLIDVCWDEGNEQVIVKLVDWFSVFGFLI